MKNVSRKLIYVPLQGKELGQSVGEKKRRVVRVNNGRVNKNDIEEIGKDIKGEQ